MRIGNKWDALDRTSMHAPSSESAPIMTPLWNLSFARASLLTSLYSLLGTATLDQLLLGLAQVVCLARC